MKRTRDIEKLIADVIAAIAAYDDGADKDHLKHGPGADCIRCQLAQVVGLGARKPRSQ